MALQSRRGNYVLLMNDSEEEHYREVLRQNAVQCGFMSVEFVETRINDLVRKLEWVPKSDTVTMVPMIEEADGTRISGR